MSMSPGIHSDEWAAYKLVAPSLELGDKAVNYSIYFVNPANGVHIQNIETYWARHKYMIKCMKRISRSK